MTNLTTAGAALRLGLAGGERREVVVEHELLVVLDENFVHLLHVHLGAQGNGGQRLGFTAGEDGAAVGAREVIHFAPDGAHLVGGAAVQALAFVQHQVAHGFLLHVVVVAVDHGTLHFQVFLGEAGLEFVADGVEAVLALMLGLGALGELIALVIASLVHGLAEVFVLLVVRVVALVHVRTQLVHEFFLHAAVLLDFFVGELDGLQHVVLGNLVHLTFYHHDIFLCGGNHQVQIGPFVVLETGVDDEFTVDAGYANLAHGTAEGQVAGGKGGRCGQTGKGIRLDVFLCRDEHYIHKDLQVEVLRPQRADGTVHKTGDEHLIVRGAAFALEETSGETAGGIVFFTIIHGEGHEVRTLFHLRGAGDGGEQHGATHFHNGRTGSLFGEFSGFDLDYPTVG